MLTTILNYNEAINNYILELNLPYSSALKNHMINLVSGITDNPCFLLSTDISLDNQTMISYYEKRWNI